MERACGHVLSLRLCDLICRFRIYWYDSQRMKSNTKNNESRAIHTCHSGTQRDTGAANIGCLIVKVTVCPKKNPPLR